MNCRRTFFQDKENAFFLQSIITFYCSSNAAPAEKKAVVGDDAALRTTRSY